MIGTVLGSRYEVSGIVTDGPVFAAYSARDRTSGRDVLVRVVKPPFNAQADMLDELKTCSQRYGAAKGPMIESITDVGSDGNSIYYVTDLSRGPTLAERIKKLAPFSIPVSVATAISICQALEPIHRLGLAHGDLASSNILVLANGDVKLQLAGVWEVYSVSASAGAMVLPGMAPYLAPEVSSGRMPSAASDVYAIGVLLYELLTGRMPYYGETTVSVAIQHATSEVPRVRDVNPSVPSVLEEIIRKALSKDPEDRYSSSAGMLSDLRQVQDALRFGRSLNWPIRQSGVSAASVPLGTNNKGRGNDLQPVAPRMSAVRTDEEVETSKRRARVERDVPIWMTMMIVFLAAVLLSLVGVWMLMNLNRPELVAIPNVVNLTSQEARAVLQDSKLEIKIGARLPSEKFEMDHVMDVLPTVGQRVRQGSRVTLTLSSGSRLVAVPDLKGLTRDKAQTILNSLNLQIDPQIVNEPDPNVEQGLILRSKPEAKGKVERNSRIQLFMSSGPNGSRTTEGENSQGGGFLYTVRIRLDDLKESTPIKLEMTDSQGSREIFNEVRSPGDTIEVSAIGQGKEATFTIYYNDVKVKEVTKAADAPEAPR